MIFMISVNIFAFNVPKYTIIVSILIIIVSKKVKIVSIWPFKCLQVTYRTIKQREADPASRTVAEALRVADLLACRCNSCWRLP